MPREPFTIIPMSVVPGLRNPVLGMMMIKLMILLFIKHLLFTKNRARRFTYFESSKKILCERYYLHFTNKKTEV